MKMRGGCSHHQMGKRRYRILPSCAGVPGNKIAALKLARSQARHPRDLVSQPTRLRASARGNAEAGDGHGCACLRDVAPQLTAIGGDLISVLRAASNTVAAATGLLLAGSCLP